MKENQNFNVKKAFRFKRFVKQSYSVFNSLNKTVSIGVVAATVLIFAHSTPSAAQTQAADHRTALMEKELDEVMVTASLSELPMEQIAKPVAIITREQIEQAPVRSIEDLLIYVAGVNVAQRGGHGVQADISLRGGSADQTAILLNGINLTNAQTGHYSFDIPINLSDIERIEIIEGSSSLIYGASAFSGGINIITKKDAKSNAYLSLGAGMHNMYAAEGRAAVSKGIISSSLSFGYKTSGGYIANSDYDMYNALLQTNLQLNEANRINLQLGYNDKHYGANTFYSAKYPNQYERTDTYLGTLKGSFGKGENSALRVVPSLYWTRHHDQFDLIKNTPTGRNYHRNDTYGGGLNLRYTSKYGITTLGGELRRDEILSTNLGKTSNQHGAYYKKYDSRTNTSLAADHTLTLDKVNLSAGIMFNRSSHESDWYYLPSFSVSYKASDNYKIYASWSKAMREPTFTDLYYSTVTHSGNDLLKTERSENVEVGMNYRNHFMSAYATGYMAWGKNMIDWIRPLGTTVWESNNLTRVDNIGLELGVKFQLYGLWNALGEKSTFSIDYVRMHQRKNAVKESFESKYALNYLRDKVTVNFSHQIIENLTMNWYWRFQTKEGQYQKYDIAIKDYVGMRNYPSYAIFDVKVNYRIKNFEVNMSANNILDKKYFDIDGIAQPGFWLMGGISYRFN